MSFGKPVELSSNSTSFGNFSNHPAINIGQGLHYVGKGTVQASLASPRKPVYLSSVVIVPE